MNPLRFSLAVLALLPLLLAGSVDARQAPASRACKIGLCKRAIGRCVKETCKHAPGPTKAACKKYARSTWVTGCVVSGDSAGYCGQIDRNGCNGS